MTRVYGHALKQIRFFDTVAYSPTDVGTDFTMGTPTDVVMDFDAMGTGAGWQSAKADLGYPWAAEYACFGIVDYGGETAPPTGTTVDYYWAPSTSATPGTGNIYANSGGNAAALDGATAAATLVEFVAQCIPIGSLVLSTDAVVQNGYVGILSPPTQWGQLILVNNGGDNFEAGAIEVAQFLNPLP